VRIHDKRNQVGFGVSCSSPSRRPRS
jgi:hypothetical protein